MFTRVIYCIIVLSVQACTVTPHGEPWPKDLPERQLFIENCQKNSSSCSNPNKTAEYMHWIKRFYYGSIFYPTGWNEMTQLLISSLPNERDKAIVKQRIEKLGLDIAFEWAKDNRERLIDSQLLATWGNALRTSAERNEQIEFISQIETDVSKILSLSLKPEEITFERYYPAEVYDNF